MEIVELTEETILKTRTYFIKSKLEGLEEVLSGKVNFYGDVDKFTKDTMEYIEDVKEGCQDHYLYFIQRATYIQTGESVPLLPKRKES